MTQEQALAILKTGASVFLTGEPGSGKTYLINAYARYLRECEIEPAITASTGIAATHIQGRTIHSWSGIGIKRSLTKNDLEKLFHNRFVRRRVESAKVLIIEEISMLSAPALAMVDTVCRTIRADERPFGGLQTVLVGDFFQLPPVSAKGEAPTRFAFESETWQELNPTVCYLTEQYRQDDPIFLSLLTSIRAARCGAEHQTHLRGRVDSRHATRSDLPRLFAHNADVDAINAKELAKLPGEAREFSMTSSGSKQYLETLKRGCLSPENLQLKIGAAVMCTKNNPEQGFINGTLGMIARFEKDSGYPVMCTRDKREILVEPLEWTVEEDGKVKARIKQIPLRLAWAMTIHKSQGMTMDGAVIDLSAAFEFGQGYVALSRVRRLSGLYLLGFNERALEVHPDVLARDQLFRAESQEAETKLRSTPTVQLETTWQNFIRDCGGHSRGSGSAAPAARPKQWLDNQRAKHANAYQPWSKEDDDLLRTRYKAGMTVAELIEFFNRNVGAIQSRLKKLGLIE